MQDCPLLRRRGDERQQHTDVGAHGMLMASRLLYGLAPQDVLSRSPGRVLPGRRTPWVGILFSTVLALILIGAAFLFFVGPWARDRDDWIQYQVAGLVLLGIVLWVATWATNRGVRAKKTGFRDIEHLED